LLFHPDKYDIANESIKQTLHELFIQIKDLYETSIAQLLAEIEIIQQANYREEDHEEILQAYREFCREFLKDFTAVYENYEKKVTAIYKEMEVQMKEHHAEIKTRYAEAEAKMQEWERLFKARMAPQQNQIAASDSETAGTSYSFFPARR
jgi:phytoene dehydrogenase-like protein